VDVPHIPYRVVGGRAFDTHVVEGNPEEFRELHGTQQPDERNVGVSTLDGERRRGVIDGEHGVTPVRGYLLRISASIQILEQQQPATALMAGCGYGERSSCPLAVRVALMRREDARNANEGCDKLRQIR
jgi:hypothetical protein